jgi:hypothetical protein
MSLLPHRTLELRSGLSAHEAVDALAHVVKAPRAVRLLLNAGLFEGTVTGQTFNIQRIIRYRNSSLPEIRGKPWLRANQSWVTSMNRKREPS